MRKVNESKSKKVKGKNVSFLKFTKLFSNRKYLYGYFCLFTFLILFLPSLTVAQEQFDTDDAPPPLKIISKQEKSLLDTETDVSDRTKLSLELMENRLKKAEDFYARESYVEMSNELGGFSALMDNTLIFLKNNDNGGGKILNNFKRLEINLRKFSPRLELIRRELPIRFESYIRNLIKSLRQARAKAVETLFDDSVVPNNTKGNQNDTRQP
jgi:hypothetical protein